MRTQGKSVRAGEQQYRSLFETMAQGVIYQNAKGEVVAANPAAQRILGLTLDQMQGRTPIDPYWRAVHEDGSPVEAETYPAVTALRTGRPVYNVVMGIYFPAEDQYRWINSSAVPEFYESGIAPYQVYTTVEDITERKKIEQQLRESEARFHALFENAPMQCTIYRLIRNAEGEIVDWEISAINPLGAASIGGQAQELIGKRALALFGPEAMASYLQTSRQIAASGTPQFFETHFETNGRDYLSSVFLLESDHYATVGVDITDRKQTEEAARRRERQLQALVSSLDDIVFEVDAHGTYLEVWTADKTTLFRPREEVIGKRFDEVFGEEASRPFFEFLARTLASDTPQTLEYSLEIAGTQRWFAARYNPIHQQDAACTTVSVVVRDITARRQAETLVYAQRDLARCIGTLDSIEAGFSAILEIMLRLTGMDSGGIYLFSPAGQSLDLIYHQGLSDQFVQTVASYAADSPNVDVILTGKPFYFPQGHPVTQSPRYLAEQLRSGAAIPILYQDRVIGCFNLASHTRDEVRQFARQALEPLAVEVGNFVMHLQSQAALRASEEKFRQLADSINEVFWIFDHEQQRLVYLNPAFEKIWGISIEDTYRNSGNYIDALHPDDRLILFAALERQAQGEQTEMEYRIVRPDGTVRWIFDRSFPILGGDGQVRRTTGVATDITALKHVQQELQELNRVLEERVSQRTAEVQDLYDNAPMGYHSLDADGRFVRVNQTALNWLGYTREELIGRTFSEFITVEGQATFLADFSGFKQRGWARDIEYDLVRKDGSTFAVLISATAVYNEQGSFVASRSTLFDNTEHKRADQALRASEETLRFANAELARALRMKDEFLANMSHELRTPLHGILAMTETLVDQVRGPLNERQLNSVVLIEQSGRHLLALINDLLDLSKIEAGKLELHCEPLSVDAVCRASLLFVREMAMKKEIRVDYASAAPGAQITADEQRLKQMLVNLLSNAVKFTPNGGHVRVGVALDPNAALIHFAVQDNGPGIAPADQARLFQPFVQVDARLSRQHDGSGLGLALVKRLADQHGGTVRLDSTGVPGEGCCFTITLPTRPKALAHGAFDAEDMQP